MAEDERMSALITSALAVAIERAGGELAYTQTEFAAIRASRGEYRIEAEVDKSGPGEPVIRVRFIPKPGSMPVS